jgi:uncharacterized protein (DUF427 family)
MKLTTASIKRRLTMGKSPGHRKMPDHKVEEQRLKKRVQVEVGGRVIADSEHVILVREDDYPDRYYFPRADISMNLMERTDSTSTCPFKGEANYYSLNVGDKQLDDAAWTYEDPYEEHAALKGRIAFYDDKREIDVRPGEEDSVLARQLLLMPLHAPPCRAPGSCPPPPGSRSKRDSSR